MWNCGALALALNAPAGAHPSIHVTRDAIFRSGCSEPSLRDPRVPAGPVLIGSLLRSGLDHVGQCCDEEQQRGPVVEAQAQDVVDGIDAQVLDPSTPQGVAQDI